MSGAGRHAAEPAGRAALRRAGWAALESRWLGYAAFAGVLLLVPAVFTRVPFYSMAVAVLMCLLAIAALGLVPLTGRAGQISLGQAAFYGVGGYTSAVLTTRWHLPAPLAMLTGMALAGLLAWLVGLFIFRVQGHYLALATLAFGLALSFLAGELPITGGSAGVPDVPRLSFPGVVIGSDLAMFYLAAAVLLVAVVVVDTVLRSALGRGLTALGDSPVATAACGVSVVRLRRGAFTLAAVLGALAGSLYAHWTSFVDPDLPGLLNSVQLLVVVTVGGMRTVWGPPLGAFVIVTFSQASKDVVPALLPNAVGDYEVAVYGIALILVLLFLPKGVGGGLIGLVGNAVRRGVPRRG
jgi:branched-chain amino acid transport system permease protein